MKEKILNEARLKFFKFGYSRVRVDEIAEELVISKKTVYNHFLGKEDILDQLIDQLKVDFENQILEIENDDNLTYIEQVHSILSLMGNWLGEMAVFTEDLKKHQPDSWEKLNKYRKDVVISHSSRILNAGVEKGYLKPGNKLQIALFMFMVSAEKITDMAYAKTLPGAMVDAFPAEPAERLRLIINIIYEGINNNQNK